MNFQSSVLASEKDKLMEQSVGLAGFGLGFRLQYGTSDLIFLIYFPER